MNGVAELIAAVHHLMANLVRFLGLSGSLGLVAIFGILYLRARATRHID